MMKTLPILTIQIADVLYDEVLRDISDAIDKRKQLVIMYASMHIINLAQNDSALAGALAAADIVHPDGIGVWLSSKLLHGNGFRDRFNWSDHAHEFLAFSAERRWRIFILGSTTESLMKTVARLRDEIPELTIAGFKNGFGDVESAALIDEINQAHPDILWVGMGSPKQELWIHQHRSVLQCHVIQSVGDAISLLAGEKIRGPRFFRGLGLEWVFRILSHPTKYFSRYVFGIPRFSAMVLKDKFISKGN